MTSYLFPPQAIPSLPIAGDERRTPREHLKEHHSEAEDVGPFVGAKRGDEQLGGEIVDRAEHEPIHRRAGLIKPPREAQIEQRHMPPWRNEDVRRLDVAM